MDCVVTGGAGFIGSNLVDALLARGDRVAVIDDFSTGKHVNLTGAVAQGASVHELDVRDAKAVGTARGGSSTPPPAAACTATPR
jgi:UDP-glucose 4-epimerase